MDDIIADLKRFSGPLVGVRIRNEDIPAKEKPARVSKVPKGSSKVPKVSAVEKTVTPNVPAGVDLTDTVEVDTLTKNKKSTKGAAKIPKTSLTAKVELPTVEEIATRVLPPLQVVRKDGVIENIDSGMRLICPRGHIHNHMFLDIMAKTPVCKTCAIPGVITKRIREQIEDIFGVPFYLVNKEKTYCHYLGNFSSTNTNEGPTAISTIQNIHLYIVKSGYQIESPEQFCIVLPESQSRLMINESIYKQCVGTYFSLSANDKIKLLAPKPVVKKDVRLPYSMDFAGDSMVSYKTIANDKLYIENCGWK